jgi:hypothetical protein
LQVKLASKLCLVPEYETSLGLSAAPLTHWRNLLSTSDGFLAPRATETIMDTNTSLLAAELLLQAGDAYETAAAITEEVVQPWEAAREETRQLLRRRLAELDPAIPLFIDGAWHDVSLNGPAATMKIANAVVEMLDRSLRAAAPDAAVLSWRQATGRPDSELNDGRPTRALRFRYIAHEARLPEPLIQSQVTSLSALMKEAQKAKHSVAVEHTTARVFLITAESLLTSLFTAER